MKKMIPDLADPGEKAISGMVFGLITYTLGSINLSTIILFLFIIIDWVTGNAADRRNGVPFDKKKAKDGIYEKAAMITFWFCSVLIQAVIVEHGPDVGITLKHPIIVIVATFYMLGTEILSSLNNIEEMGFKIPKPFKQIGERMRDVVEIIFKSSTGG